MKPKALVSWSSGKDAAWALHTVAQQGELEPVGLLTSFNEKFGRVSMHGVRTGLVDIQARLIRLPIWPVELPWPCPSGVYEARMAAVMGRAGDEGVEAVVFGDLFLEDVRDYRINRMAGTGIEPLFPIWAGSGGTGALAREMVDAGVRAVITAVDTSQIDRSFAGRSFDGSLIDDLPETVDPLGENGEFHTFCYAGPLFADPIRCEVGAIEDRGRFVYADVVGA